MTTGPERPYPPISIVGIGSRVPSAANATELWRILPDDTATPQRNAIRHLDHVDWFDNGWFAIPDRAAALIEPWQRLAMEVAVEAIDDAGIGYRTRGSGAAVVFGACEYQPGAAVFDRGDAPRPALDNIANRISAALDLRGPSLIVNSACSSSLAALDYALRLLGDQTVPFAVVGGVDVESLPRASDSIATHGFPIINREPAETGHFGCVVVVLQRTVDALRDGSRIYAEIIESGWRSNGVDAVNGQAAQNSTAIAELDTRNTREIEYSCTRVPLNNADRPRGAGAVDVSAAAPNTNSTEPIPDSSIESDPGRPAAAAGVTNVIQAALSIWHGVLAPTIDFDGISAPLPKHGPHLLEGDDTLPNLGSHEPEYRNQLSEHGNPRPHRSTRRPKFSSQQPQHDGFLSEHGDSPPNHRDHRSELGVPGPGHSGQKLPGSGFPIDWSAVPRTERRASVSSFGFGGNNAHVVLRGVSSSLPQLEGVPVVIPVSGRDVAELRERAQQWADLLAAVPNNADRENSDATGTGAPTVLATGSKYRAAAPTPAVGTSGAGRSGYHQQEARGDGEYASGARDNADFEYANSGTHRQFACAVARLIPENYRAAVVAGDRDGAVRQLRALALGAAGSGLITPSSGRRQGGLLFVFSAPGAQYPKMGRSLAARYPVFSAKLNDVSEAIVAAGGPRVWTARNGFPFDAAMEKGQSSAELGQSAVFAFQVALADLLASWGVEPDAVVGHGIGEIAGATVSGALSLADAARVIVRRSRILAQTDGPGAMAVLAASSDEVGRLVEPLRGTVAIAAVNGPHSVVISGEPRYVDVIVRRAKRRNISAQRTAVDFAIHSRRAVAVIPEFISALGGLEPKTPHLPVYSTTRPGAPITTAAMDAAYWGDNVYATVEMAAALRCAARDGLSTVLEIAPHPVLLPSIRQNSDFADSAHPVVSGDNETEAFLACLGNLYAEGRPINWTAAGQFTVAPPKRLWQRTRIPHSSAVDNGTNDSASDGQTTRDLPATEPRHAVGADPHASFSDRSAATTTDSISSDVDSSAEPGSAAPVVVGTGRVQLGGASKTGSAEVVTPADTDEASEDLIAESDLSADDLAGHVVQGIATVPAVYWVRRLLRLAHETSSGAMLADFVVHERTDRAALSAVGYRRDAQEASVRAEVTGAGTLASARLAGDPTPADIVAWMRLVDANRAARGQMRVVAADGFYQALRRRQLEYGTDFRPLRGIRIGQDGAVGSFDSPPLQRSATLDGCLHLLAAASYADLPPAMVPMPTSIESVWISTEADRVLLEAHAFVRNRSATGLVGDVIGTDQHGVPVLAFTGVQVRFAAIGRIARVHPVSNIGPFRHEAWEPLHCKPSEQPPTSIRTDGMASNQPRSGTEPHRALVIGESLLAIRLARELDRSMATERVGRRPEAAGPLVSLVLAGRTASSRTAVVIVWPDESGAIPSPGSDATDVGNNATDRGHITVATTARVLDLIQRIRSEDATASLTIVLPDHDLPTTPNLAASERHDRGGEVPTTHQPSTTAFPRAAGRSAHGKPAAPIGVGFDGLVPMAIAGSVRSLQLESDTTVRLIWTDAAAESLSSVRELIATTTAAKLSDELRVSQGVSMIRQFRHARPAAGASIGIDPNGTYVVTGGLGKLGSVAVRWLLDAGARDVVVLTRSPRPVPELLDGLEDRIVPVRCDTADRIDLANALNDIRACGSTVRGIVHAAGALEESPFDAVTSRQLERMFAPKLIAAANLIELTATDPIDFVLLFSAAAGAFGAPGQAAYAGANAALDGLAAAHPGRRVLSIGWGAWESGLTDTASGAVRLRRAGITPFDSRRGGELLTQALRYPDSHLVALDYAPTADSSPIATRLAALLTQPDRSATSEETATVVEG